MSKALLQETRLSDQEQSALLHTDIAIFIFKKLKFECKYVKKDPDGRFCFDRGYILGGEPWFLLYAPPVSERNKFKPIFELQVSDSQESLICGGDFSVQLHPILDASKQCHTGEKKVTKNIKLMMRELPSLRHMEI